MDLIRSNGDVVDEDLRVAGIAEQAGTADQVADFVDSLDRPFLRLFAAALPNLALQPGLFALGRSTQLDRVPHVRLPGKMRVLGETVLELRRPTADLHLLVRTHLVERVAL